MCMRRTNPADHCTEQGMYLHDEEQEAAPTDLCVGAACYPEKHAEALNLDTDIAYLKQKVDAGAEYLVTQMFFDNARYYRFVDLCRAERMYGPHHPRTETIDHLETHRLHPEDLRHRPTATSWLRNW